MNTALLERLNRLEAANPSESRITGFRVVCRESGAQLPDGAVPISGGSFLVMPSDTIKKIANDAMQTYVTA